MSTENSELALLDKVLFQLAVLPDDSLQEYLFKILVPVIEKIDSSYEASKSKVLEILTHINKRVKPRANIKLPIVDIVQQLTLNTTTTAQKSFLNMYLQMGFERCSVDDKIGAAKVLIPALQSFPEETQYFFLSTILPVLDKVESDKEGCFANEQVRSISTKYLFRVMLLNQSAFQNESNSGLSDNERTLVFKGIQSNCPTLKDLNHLKLIILKFIEAARRLGLFLPEDLLPISVIASGDNTSQIAEKGEDLMKNLKQLNLESKPALTSLFQLFVGTPLPEKRQPVNNQIKEKILDVFLKSKLACNSFPSTIQVIFEALFGAETSARLQLQGLRFVDWVCRLGQEAQMKVMAPLLLNGLKKMLNHTQLDPAQEITLKSLTYQCIGMLGKRKPDLFATNFELLKSFFETIANEKDQNVRQSLQDGLVNLCVAYLQSSADMKTNILELLFVHVSENNIQSKYLANYYALRLFPFSHVASRYLNIISLNESSPQVRDESSRGLKPFSLEEDGVVLKADSQAQWPRFDELMHFLITKRKNEGLPFSPLVLQSIVQFASETLIKQQNNSNTIDSDETITATLTGYGKDVESAKNVINMYWTLLSSSWNNVNEVSQELLLLSLRSALNLFGWLDFSLLQPLISSQLEVLLSICKKGGISRQCREVSAKLLAIGYAHQDNDLTHALITDLLNQLTSGDEKTANREIRVGLIYLIAYAIHHTLDLDKKLDESLIRLCVSSLLNLYKQQSFYLAVSVQAIGLICKFYNISTLTQIKVQNETVSASDSVIASLSLADDASLEIVTNAVANICLGCRSEELLKGSSEALLKLFKKKLETHFTIGEALSVVASGWDSTASTDPLLVLYNLKKRTTPPSDEPMRTMLQVILGEYLLSDRVDTRSPGAIWLLSLIKHSPTHPVILRNLFDIQKAFSFLLSDNDEVIQESAAKGLALVYECGSEEIKDKLVSELVTTIAHGKGGFKVTSNTELFPKGFLGNTPSGSSITSYKDICDMAEDLNQPELVYKFMGLATHNTLWNSKKGAAFAATALASSSGDAKIELKGHMDHLIPKLYRSSYDPSYNISQSMSRILDSFANRKEIHEKFFDIIIQDLLENIWNVQWRTRESCCNALADILTGKTMEKVEPYIADLWPKVFKVSDDEKETVRTAAQVCMKTLGNLTIRLCDPTKNSIPQGKKAIELVLPYLCQKGLMSQVKEVREFSMDHILKIVKVAGLLLKNYVSMLVGVLLNALDELEEGNMNYLQLQADKLGITGAVESARIALSTNSPMNDTLKLLIEEVDEHNASDVVDVLLHTLSKAVGLQARVGAARFLQQLIAAKPAIMTPYLPKFLSILQRSVFSAKSPAVKQAYSQCMGYLCRYTPASHIQKLIQELKTSYFSSDPDDKSSRRVVAIVFHELSKASTGVLNEFYQLCVPLIFFGRHESDDETKKLFQETWSEIGAGVSLYVAGIASTIIESLSSNSWALKKQAANTLETLLTSLNSDSIEPSILDFVTAIRKSLKGSTWEGKESIVSALGSLVTNGKPIIKNNFEVYKDIATDLLNETKREKKPYKHRIIHTLAIVMDAFNEINPSFDMFSDFYDKLVPIIEKSSKQDDDTDKKDDEEKKKESMIDTSIKSSAITALISAWPAQQFETQKKYCSDVLSILTKQTSNLANPLTLKLACINALIKFTNATYISIEQEKSILSTSIFQLVIDSLSNSFMDPSSAVRSCALKALKTILVRAKETDLFDPLADITLKKLAAINAMYPNKHYEIEELTLLLKKGNQ